jgi:anti-sigma regulatory factor (Ser/Thr protein kinase)
MTETAAPRILICSRRPDLVAEVTGFAESLDPPPEVLHTANPPPDHPPCLAIIDIADPTISPVHLQTCLGPQIRTVALIESAWVDRLGRALSGEWFDYLFFPINRSELGLVWRRHLADVEEPSLDLDVRADGTIRLICPSRVVYQRPAVERVVEACRHLGGLDADAAFRLQVAMGEAVANAILYGNGEDPSRFVTIEAEARPEFVKVRVADEGTGFDPGSIPDPTGTQGVQRSRGRGLFLLRSLMDEVSFNEIGNQVTLVLRATADFARRLGPLMGAYERLTGLEFRLIHREDDGTEELYASAALQSEAVPGSRTRSRLQPIPEQGTLELHYVPGDPGREAAGTPDRDSAARFLLSWVTEVLAADASREDTQEKRLNRQRVLAELEVARDLQLRLLPEVVGFSDLAEIAARCEPALSLGGDFYYLTRVGTDRLGVMLGDVSSHGPSAALIMALTLSAAAVVTGQHEEPGDVLIQMQRQLLATLESTEMYMTLFYGVLDRRNGRLRYANAGHGFAFRVGGEGLTRLEALDPPIGMTAPERYLETEVDWVIGMDTLLLFTDGLAEGLDDPTIGPRERLAPLVGRGATGPADLVNALFGDREPTPADDRTAVAVRL